MARIGVKNFAYAICTKDDETGVAYGTPKRIIGLNQVNINRTVQRATAYGDDLPLETSSNISEIRIGITSVNLPLEDKAILLGHTIDEKGGMITKTDDVAPYVAIMFESKRSDGAIEYHKWYKGQFAESQETFDTKGQNINYQLPSIEASFVARAHDGRAEYTMVTTDTSIAASWYASVEEEGDVVND